MINYELEFYESKDYQSFDESLPENWNMKYEDMDKIIKRFLPEAKTFLDIGCGRGRAMRRFARLGYSVYGIEPSHKAISENVFRDLTVQQGYFPERKPDIKMDVINLEQVLSHCEFDQWEHMLNEANKLLNDDGIIVIEDPNDGNPLQKVLGKEYNKHWEEEDHRTVTMPHMRELLEGLLNFEVLHATCTYPTEFFLMMGFDTSEEKTRQYCHKLRYKLLKSMGYELRTKLREMYAGLGIGRSYRFYVKKK